MSADKQPYNTERFKAGDCFNEGMKPIELLYDSGSKLSAENKATADEARTKLERE